MKGILHGFMVHALARSALGIRHWSTARSAIRDIPSMRSLPLRSKGAPELRISGGKGNQLAIFRYQQIGLIFTTFAILTASAAAHADGQTTNTAGAIASLEAQAFANPAAGTQAAAAQAPAAAQTPVPRVACASKPGTREHCPADTSAGVILVRSIGEAPCLLGRTWGYDDTGIWVSDGCSAEFVAGQVAGGSDPAGSTRARSERRLPAVFR